MIVPTCVGTINGVSSVTKPSAYPPLHAANKS
jgi:hypothetical protein